jgi:hypothetical protein
MFAIDRRHKAASIAAAMKSLAAVLVCTLSVSLALAAPPKGKPTAKKPPPPPSAAPARPSPPPSGGEPAAAPAPSNAGGPRGGATGSPAARKGAAEQAPDNAAADAAAKRGGPTRVDFDDRLVQGQSTKQGAIYLFERKENPLRSMLRKRENFRSEISGSIQ